MDKSSSERPIVVYGAIIGNLLIAVSKFVVATLSGSSAMLSEAIHSTADTGNQGLILLGLKRSKKPADDLHRNQIPHRSNRKLERAAAAVHSAVLYLKMTHQPI